MRCTARWVVISGLLLLPLAACSAESRARLEGCTDPKELRAAFQRLSDSQWEKLDPKDIQAYWPAELLGVDCNSEWCTSIGSKGRIINGHYECGEIFFFGDRGPGRHSQGLQNVVIHYASTDKLALVQLAKNFAALAGAPSKGREEIGHQEASDLVWERPGNQVSILHVDLTVKSGRWTLDFNLARKGK